MAATKIAMLDAKRIRVDTTPMLSKKLMENSAVLLTDRGIIGIIKDSKDPLHKCYIELRSNGCGLIMNTCNKIKSILEEN